MQNTVLDAEKYYILADKKTGLKWADNTVTQGIAKFTGKAEKPRVIKVTNFEGKVPGSKVEKPHFAVTYNSSNYLFANVKLGQVRDRKDTLFRENGEWKLWREIEKDVALDSSSAWVFGSSYTNYKRIKVNLNNALGNSIGRLVKYDGKDINHSLDSNYQNSDIYRIDSAPSLNQTVSNEDTGFADAYTPTIDEIKAYFNGWKVKLIDLDGKPTVWQSVVDGKDALTHTLAYISANRAPNYTPYKLSYVLSSPVTEVVTVNVEGDIAINGLTQVEVGSGVIIREKAKTEASSTVVHINDVERPNTYLKYKSNKIINIYKNGAIDNGWAIASGRSFGISRASLPISDFDATAEYTVTYLVLDRHLFTTNPVSIPVSLAGSLKGRSIRSNTSFCKWSRKPTGRKYS